MRIDKPVMNLSDFPTHPTRRVLRQFAGAWLAVLLLAAARKWAWHHDNLWALALAILGVLVGGLGLIWPRTLRWLFVGLMALVSPIGWLVSQVALLVLFYVVITPLAAFMRLKGRDHLRRRPMAGETSLWRTKRSGEDLRRYFRQY